MHSYECIIDLPGLHLLHISVDVSHLHTDQNPDKSEGGKNTEAGGPEETLPSSSAAVWCFIHPRPHTHQSCKRVPRARRTRWPPGVIVLK